MNSNSQEITDIILYVKILSETVKMISDNPAEDVMKATMLFIDSSKAEKNDESIAKQMMALAKELAQEFDSFSANKHQEKGICKRTK